PMASRKKARRRSARTAREREGRVRWGWAWPGAMAVPSCGARAPGRPAWGPRRVRRVGMPAPETTRDGRCRPEQVVRAGTLPSRGGVLQLLQRTRLDLHRRRLGGEPLLFLGEGVDALALGLGRDLDRGDLQQAGQGEAADALLADRAVHGAFERGQHRAD